MKGGGSSASHAPSRVVHGRPNASSHAPCQPAYVSAPRNRGSIRETLCAENHFERRSAAGPRPEREPTLDARCARADVLQPLSCNRVFAVEALAVVADRHEPFSVDARSDHDVRALRVRMLAHVGETLLHDPEDLDLLVGREPNCRIDLEVYFEL